MQPAGRYTIVIAPSRSYYQNYLVSGLPAWSGAYAVPAFRTLVVKSPRWIGRRLILIKICSTKWCT